MTKKSSVLTFLSIFLFFAVLISFFHISQNPSITGRQIQETPVVEKVSVQEVFLAPITENGVSTDSNFPIGCPIEDYICAEPIDGVCSLGGADNALSNTGKKVYKEYLCRYEGLDGRCPKTIRDRRDCEQVPITVQAIETPSLSPSGEEIIIVDVQLFDEGVDPVAFLSLIKDKENKVTKADIKFTQ